MSFEVRLLSGALVASPRLPASTTVGALLSQLNSDPTLSAKLLHKGKVLARTHSLEQAGVEAGASLVLVLKKSPWQAALHGDNVELEEVCASRRGATTTFSDAVILGPERSRSFAVRLLDNSGSGPGALEVGFVSEDVHRAARSGTFPKSLEVALCRMGNSGGLKADPGKFEDPRYKVNWTSSLEAGAVIRCCLEDEVGARQRFSIYVNDELRLDRVFPTLTQDDECYPAVNLFGKTLKVEFLDS